MDWVIAKSWINIAGLVLDFVGVLLVGRTWFNGIAGGVGWGIGFQQRRAERVAQRLQKQFIQNDPGAAENRFVAWCRRISRRNVLRTSRREARILAEQRAERGLGPLALVDAQGVLDPDAVNANGRDMKRYLSDLLDSGDPRDYTFNGWILILVGLVFQIVGALPI